MKTENMNMKTMRVANTGNRRNLSALAFSAVYATLSACSSMPASNAALDQARNRFNVAQNNPDVASMASDELKQAGDSLRIADKALADGANISTVDHLAYMTSQRVAIAQETAAAKSAQAVTAGAAAERDRMRLASRTSEVNAAQRQLAVSQQNNAITAAELANADAAAVATANATAQREQANASANALRDQANANRVNDLEMQLKDLNAKKTDRGIVVTLGDVLFDSGQAKLLPDGNRNMVKLAEVFRNNPRRNAIIDGYTDSVGSANANYTLSERRAEAVMTALINLGVSAGQLTMKAHGEEQPVADNTTAAGRQMNRRVEIVFTP